MKITIQDVKDIIQSIIMVVALWISYRSISIQVKKNRKDLWIQDFRKEMARFLSLTMSVTGKNLEQLSEIAHCGMMLRMYLNLKEKQHKKLFDVISKTTTHIMENPLDTEEYKINMVEILKLSDEIIHKEQEYI